VTLLVAVVLVGATAVSSAPPPLSPTTQEAIANYLRDPVNGARGLLDAARQEPPGPLPPALAIMLGDAALREGSYRSAIDYFTSVRDQSADAYLSSVAEMGLAWAALGRGRTDDARDHFENAASLDPSQRSTTDFALALLDATNGSPDGWQALAAAAAASNDPSLREVAPIAAAYARYWNGDVDGAIDAFTAFAVAHPDSRFADDALYAAAWAKRQAGLESEATQDLEALGDAPRDQRRTSNRLMELDGRSMLREGMRRDRGMQTRTLGRRLADLLDGDGVRLAQSALANPPTDAERARRAQRDARTARRQRRDKGTGAAEGLFGAGAVAQPAGTETAVAGSSRADASHGAEGAAGTARFPWRSTLAFASLAVLLGALALAARRRPGPTDR